MTLINKKTMTNPIAKKDKDNDNDIYGTLSKRLVTFETPITFLAI